MRVTDDKLLELFRAAGECEYCGRWCERRDPAHVFARGMAGGGRVDAHVNLVSLCRRCHDESHAGKRPTRQDLIELVARREFLTPEAVVAEVMRLRRKPKGGILLARREAVVVERAVELLAWALGGGRDAEAPSLNAALAALQWSLGDGAFGRNVLAPLGKQRAKAEGK